MNGIGKQQRRILTVLRRGTHLVNDRGRWWLPTVRSPHYCDPVHARSCVGLLERGLIMSTDETRTRYMITQAGIDAIGA